MSTLDAKQIAALAERLDQARRNVQDLVKITDEFPDMDYDDAYDIQAAIQGRMLERGHTLVGLKMGLTSRAKMKQMGVEQPIYGFLTEDMALPDGAELDSSALIHPKVEAELAFVTKAELKGPGCHIGDVMAATDFVVPALEVIDSRYRDFKFDLISVVADNTSAAGFLTGAQAVDPSEVDLRTVGVVVEKNGVPVETGAGAAVLGHPALSVAMLANMLAKRDQTIPAGTFILTGGITKAVLVEPGDSITARFQHMGTVGCVVG